MTHAASWNVAAHFTANNGSEYRRIPLLPTVNLNSARIYFHFLSDWWTDARHTFMKFDPELPHSPLSRSATSGTVSAHFWYRTGNLLVQCQYNCGIVLACFWYRTGTLLVSCRRNSDTVLAHFWHRIGKLLVQCRYNSGTVLAHFWYRTGAMRDISTVKIAFLQFLFFWTQ